jgi:hypothetical protein
MPQRAHRDAPIILPWARATRHQVTQPLRQQGREHGVAILGALAMFDAHGHAFTINIADFERRHFTGPKAVTAEHLLIITNTSIADLGANA